MIFVFRDLLTATQRFYLLVSTYTCISAIIRFTSAFDFLGRCSVICLRLVNYCHLLQILFCGIRSGNVIDGMEVGIFISYCE